MAEGLDGERFDVVLGSDHIAVGLVGPLGCDPCRAVGIKIAERGHVARCVEQRPPAGVAVRPLVTVVLNEEFVKAGIAAAPDVLAAELVVDGQIFGIGDAFLDAADAVVVEVFGEEATCGAARAQR